ncbi:NAD(P)/FAD-dependent oxidoreductase [Alkaliphilus sp. MSJ-5]|uniref:NAD(P)/FAD-dependent oxidoreductase n=2 Tax=Alkaliphilus flagellatus TaxID=2841507 RepID=A0ABS6G2U3_9FIRM|nr:NAD(P)/FAD-dependent oxidoreductase [Alkaliphilus flagellatus]MBU5676797.1 NAD(P)/FAD-dependent oxidoreductase [Alkaliphilus flagellatus]
MFMQREVAIIGGGAAGMMAAIVASRNGAKVVIYERMNRVGKKLLATGNGRCNITNIGLSESNLKCIHGSNKKFAGGILKKFTVDETINFFEILGIAHKVENDGKVFPMSDQASSVLDVLRYELDKLSIEVICDIEIDKIKQSKQEFILIDSNGVEYKADKVIIATGGMSSPNLGSNGSGYKLARNLGHSVVNPFPALVQLKLEAPFLKSIKGIKFNGAASVILDGNILRREEGELLFTEYGISGPPILQLSRNAVEALENKQQPIIEIDMFPNFTYEELLNLISLRLSYQYDRPLDFSFIGLINKRLIPIILKVSNIYDLNRACLEISNKEIEKIVSLLKAWQFDIIGSQSWMHSQVTAGGVDLKEICPDTLQSKIIPGIYFAGELLDVDGDCGGFNLQWAWSSGYVAGNEASM